MGIVVAVFLFVGVLLLLPRGVPGAAALQRRRVVVTALGSGLLLSGLWNFAWYGLQHLGEFWGRTALVSGALMVAAAVVVLIGRVAPGAALASRSAAHRRWLAPWAAPLMVGLAVCFVLYAVTLVRLNLGYPIPGP